MNIKTVAIILLVTTFYIGVLLWQADADDTAVPVRPDSYSEADERAQLLRGQEVYRANCQTCHGEKYDGMGDAGKYMDPHPRNLLADHFKNGDEPEQVFNTVTNGLNGTAMASFGAALPESDRKAVAAYVTTLRRRAAFSAFQK